MNKTCPKDTVLPYEQDPAQGAQLYPHIQCIGWDKGLAGLRRGSVQSVYRNALHCSCSGVAFHTTGKRVCLPEVWEGSASAGD